MPVDSVLRPKPPPGRNRGSNRAVWSLHMRDEHFAIRDAAFRRAEEMGVTVSSLTFEAIREYLENHRDSG